MPIIADYIKIENIKYQFRDTSLTETVSNLKIGSSLVLSIEPNTNLLTGTLFDQDGNILGQASSVTLPVGDCIVSASYSSSTKTLTLTNKNGIFTDIPLNDLVDIYTGSGAISVNNNVISVNVDNDTIVLNNNNQLSVNQNSNHRMVTDTQINTWNNKSDFSGSYNDLTDKPTIVQPIQSDWLQTDTSALDYIKNKPANNYVIKCSTLSEINNLPNNTIFEWQGEDDNTIDIVDDYTSDTTIKKGYFYQKTGNNIEYETYNISQGDKRITFTFKDGTSKTGYLVNKEINNFTKYYNKDRSFSVESLNGGTELSYRNFEPYAYYFYSAVAEVDDITLCEYNGNYTLGIIKEINYTMYAPYGSPAYGYVLNANSQIDAINKTVEYCINEEYTGSLNSIAYNKINYIIIELENGYRYKLYNFSGGSGESTVNSLKILTPDGFIYEVLSNNSLSETRNKLGCVIRNTRYYYLDGDIVIQEGINRKNLIINPDYFTATVTEEILSESITVTVPKRYDANGNLLPIVDESTIIKRINTQPFNNSQIQSDWEQTDNSQPDYIKNKPLPYLLEKVTDYTYKAFVSDLDYDFAINYFQNSYDDINVGACSSVKKGNFYGRNYDWIYNNSAEFIIETPNRLGRYATIGIGGFDTLLTQDFVDSKEYSVRYKLVPFKIVDGINEKGVVCNINVVPNEKNHTITTPEIAIKKTLCNLMLPRFILDNFATAQEAVEYIRDYVSVYNYPTLGELYHYDLHLMIGDSTKTYIVEFVNNSNIIIDVTSKGIMTNFHIDGVVFNNDGSIPTPYLNEGNVTDCGVTSHGSGLERYNIINSLYNSLDLKSDFADVMDDIKYTNSYSDVTDGNKWYTEFVGNYDTYGDISVDSSLTDLNSVYAEARSLYLSRDRDTGLTWHTVHSAVFDLKNKQITVIFQENDEEYSFSINQSSQIQADWSQTDNTSVDYIKNKPSIPDVSDKMDKVNPTCSGSFSMNREENTTIGNYSVAVGYSCEASGNYSHAEGLETIARGYNSHAEGYGTKASGSYSHAEGYETVSGGVYSHAEGYSTKTSFNNQHVQGRYNIEDTLGIYAHIVGNGTSTTPSNAHTLDWSGNGWFAGSAEAPKIISNIIQGFTNTHTSLTGASPIRIVILPYIPYSIVDPTHLNQSYFKNMLDWILEESNLTTLNIPKGVPLLFVGAANPNAQGLMFGYCYGITTESNVNKMQYANFYYYVTNSQIPINFGYNSYTWFYNGAYNMTEIKTYKDDLYYEFVGTYNQSDYGSYKCRLTNSNTYSVITLKANTIYSLYLRSAWYSSSPTGIIVSTIGHTNGVPNAGFDNPANTLIKKEVTSSEALHLAVETWVHTGSSDETYYVYTRYSIVTSSVSYKTEIVATKIR